MRDFAKAFEVTGTKPVKLARFDPGQTGGLKSKKQTLKRFESNLEALAELQYRLYAEGKRSLLIVLQGIDAAGKDGTIRRVFSVFNPQGCPVTAFKVPSRVELAHDFLWRVHKAAPPRGAIGIFNRSHYEDVLVVRVHGLAPKSVWSRRFAQINRFEKHLVDNGTTILKFFLVISKDEQKRRFRARLDNPLKNWKFSREDVEKRKLWGDYLQAIEDAVNRCSTPHAPWFVIPADHKWFRNLVISQIVRDTLERLDPRVPEVTEDLSDIVIE